MKHGFHPPILVVWTGLSLVLSACGIFDKKGELKYTRVEPRAQGINSAFLDRQGRIVFPEGRRPGYETVRTLVFENHCISCHGKKGGVNLETYAETTKFLPEIKETVLDEMSMPPKRRNDPLNEDMKRLVREWLEIGAPESDLVFDTAVASPTATPAGESIAPSK